MLLSALSVLVVAQSSSEIPEGLMNNPVYSDTYPTRCNVTQFIYFRKLLYMFLVAPRDDGWRYHPKHVEQFPEIYKLCNFLFMVPCIIIFYEITNRCNYMQSILFHCQVHSTCFGRHIHPSSGVQCSTVSTD